MQKVLPALLKSVGTASRIDVWTAGTEVPPEELARLEWLLDDEERARACRFHFDADRRRSIVARGTLRSLLALYTGRQPASIRFITNGYGKPALAGGGIEFNVSHSADLVAIAVSESSPVGIDVEFERPATDLLDLAAHAFAPAELEIVRRAPPAARPALFFAIWTAKEAVIKAIGGGLSIELPSFAVDPSPGELRSVSGLPEWSVLVLPPPAAGYHLAVAGLGSQWSAAALGAAAPRRAAALP